RYKAFKGSEESGMVIVPTELITDNGGKLRSIILQLAQQNKLESNFIKWLESANQFCNSLVDRIVPGQLPAPDQKATEEKLGYTDDLMIMAEPFRLWVIESDNKKVKEVLSFSQVDNGVVISPDIEKFRELKLRLLNGTHTFCCGLAVVGGFETVKDAMNDERMLGFVKKLMLQEIAQSMDNSVVSFDEAWAFANKVLDRFRNPFLQHKWLSICLNYTSKMRMRNISLLERYYSKTGSIPASMALGFAGFILFMKGSKGNDGKYYGEAKGGSYLIEDENAAWFAERWALNDIDKTVEKILSGEEMWGVNLSVFNGFSQTVKENIRIIQKEGVLSVINSGQL
ncbi:MAG: tagaturonate reductase, partial [Bacteroidia bacterium]|nr:tagaturonate reductase [Bacteroidia bacterium]